MMDRNREYFRSSKNNTILLQNFEDNHKRHEMDSLIVYKDLSDNSLIRCFDQIKS